MCIHTEAGAVENELIVTAHLVYIKHGDLVAPGCRRKYLAAQMPLVHVIRRRIDADQNLSPGLCQLLYGIASIQAAFPVLLVVPGVLADRKRRLPSFDGG